MTQEPDNKDNLSKTNPKRLSVQISLNGLSFLILDENNVPILFEENKLSHSTTPKEILIELQSFFAKNKTWDLPYSEVSLVYATNLYSLVPSVLFDETKASEYLKFNSKILANDYVTYDTVEEKGIKVVYVPFVNINNWFFEKYGSFSYYHAITVFLNTVLNRKTSSLPQIYVHFNQNSFDCVVLSKGDLQLCNSYPFHTPEDFIYYLLFAMEQLKLDPETVPVYVCGAIEEGDSYYTMAYTYIRHLEFFDTGHSLTDIHPEAVDHQHFILKNL